VFLVVLVIALGTLCRTTRLTGPLRYRRTLGICATLLVCAHVALSLGIAKPLLTMLDMGQALDRYDWDYYANKWEALLYGLAATVGFLLLWLTSYDVFFRRMGRTAWKKLHNGMYILLALSILHMGHLGKPVCWLDWLEGTQAQACIRGAHIPPLSFLLFLAVAVVCTIRLIEPIAWPARRFEEDGEE